MLIQVETFLRMFTLNECTVKFCFLHTNIFPILLQWFHVEIQVISPMPSGLEMTSAWTQRWRTPARDVTGAVGRGGARPTVNGPQLHFVPVRIPHINTFFVSEGTQMRNAQIQINNMGPVFFNSMQFSRNFNKIVSQWPPRPPPRIPSLRKSWIRHW